MPNVVKRHQISARTAGARWSLAGCVLTLGVLATQLPSPLRSLGGEASSDRRALSASGRLDELLLVAAGVVVWILVLWIGLVVASVICVRVFAGSEAAVTLVLRCVAPQAVRAMVITAVGIGSVATLSACAPVAAGAAPGSDGPATTADTASSTTPWWSADVQYSVDWPTVDPGVVGMTTSADTASRGSGQVGDAVTPNHDPGPADSAQPDVTPASDDTPAPTSSVADPSGGLSVDLGWPAGTAPTATLSATTEPTATVPATTVPATTESAATLPAAGIPVAAAPATPAPAQIPSPAPALTPVQAPVAIQTPAPRDAIDVTVQPGDSLWSIAAEHLGSNASDTEIAVSWPQWYAANRALIGDDPDRILPGWHLTAPNPASSTSAP